MEEIWKGIKNYEGLYQVSNKGNIKSLARIDYHNHHIKERILKPVANNNGYVIVCLYKDGKGKRFTVHRIVAMSFLENSNNYTEINHKDEDKTNNCVENLEWCTHKQNINYGTRNERACKKHSEKTKQKMSVAHSKPVLQIDPVTNKIIKEWKSAKEVFEKLGFYQNAISSCCLGKHKTCGGFIWKFKNEC